MKSLPKIFVITIYVLSSSKRGRLLAQRPLARYFDGYFDDNKPYLVMYLTILFKRISGLKQVDLTAPLSRLTSLDAAKDLHSQAKHGRKLRDQDIEEKIKICILLFFLDILSKPR